MLSENVQYIFYVSLQCLLKYSFKNLDISVLFSNFCGMNLNCIQCFVRESNYIFHELYNFRSKKDKVKYFCSRHFTAYYAEKCMFLAK